MWDFYIYFYDHLYSNMYVREMRPFIPAKYATFSITLCMHIYSTPHAKICHLFLWHKDVQRSISHSIYPIMMIRNYIMKWSQIYYSLTKWIKKSKWISKGNWSRDENYLNFFKDRYETLHVDISSSLISCKLYIYIVLCSKPPLFLLA